GVADFTRVPRPAAMTTAARSVLAIRAGAPGFEPGIAGPKPAALPLGYAPLRPSIGARRWPVPRLLGALALALGEQHHEGGDGNEHDRDLGAQFGDVKHDRHEHRERLGG